MSTRPRLEARVSAQERRQINLDARIEELAEDTTTSLNQLTEDITDSFKQISEYFSKIEETMVTKQDITTTAKKEDLASIETRLNKVETLLTEILGRLPK